MKPGSRPSGVPGRSGVGPFTGTYVGSWTFLPPATGVAALGDGAHAARSDTAAASNRSERRETMSGRDDRPITHSELGPEASRALGNQPENPPTLSFARVQEFHLVLGCALNWDK